MRSQTLSTQGSQIVKNVSIMEMARRNKRLVFKTLGHRLTVPALHIAYERLSKSKASGVDGITRAEYEKNLDINLGKLEQRLKENKYKALPVKRIWIPKEDSKMRPLGIPTLEDKIVQRAVLNIIEAIYEQDFYDFSKGFRPKRGAQQALREIRNRCQYGGIKWIIDADISGFFDNLDHKKLIEKIRQRMNDGSIIRLIGKWLKAGVLDDKELVFPKHGTPQGGVISPLLANIYLHYVLDDWFVREVTPRMKGNVFLIRYADDFLIGCTEETDARSIMEVLPKRLARFGLEIHPEKTRLVSFERPSPDIKQERVPDSFDFLGFTHYWGKSYKWNSWFIKRATMKKRLKRTLVRIKEWCRENMHRPVLEQYKVLCSKLRGHYNYYGLRCNLKALLKVYRATIETWRKYLNRRTRKPLFSWKRFNKFLDIFPLPAPYVVHKDI